MEQKIAIERSFIQAAKEHSWRVYDYEVEGVGIALGANTAGAIWYYGLGEVSRWYSPGMLNGAYKHATRGNKLASPTPNS